MQTIMKGLDTKEKTYTVNAARRSKSHPFSCSSARALSVKLLSVINRRFLSQKEVLNTAQMINMFADWAPKRKRELFRWSKRMRDGEEA